MWLIFSWVKRLVIAYVIIGSGYYLSGYFYNLSTSKDKVFSPILGYLLSLYFDVIHRRSLGIKPSFLVTILAIFFILESISFRFRIEIKDENQSAHNIKLNPIVYLL